MSGAGRRPIVAGNWKMHGTRESVERLAAGVRESVADDAVDVVVCPPFVWLDAVGRTLGDSRVALGAQDVHEESEGAFTGAVSAPMLRDLGCAYGIVGHSERRALFGETDEIVARKAAALLDSGIRPIVCVGETLVEREAGRTERIVEGQVRRSLDGLAARLEGVVLAYEPVWAIGTGRTASAAQAQDVHRLIRAVVADLAGQAVADALRIQYGGSVKPSNAAELFAGADIDGGLIGGAALDADSFAAIVAAAG